MPRPTPRPRVKRALGAAPTTVLCLLALAPLAWWAIAGGGYAIADWTPAALLLVGLLVLAALTAPLTWRSVPGTVRVAVLALSAYAVWSFASMSWANDPGFALEGATRTAAYAVTFALFAWWPQRERTALWIVAAWVAVMGVAGIVLALRLTQGADVTSFFNYGRLKEPAGYPNAAAALLAMPVLPAVILSAAGGVSWWLRGVAAGIAVLLACLAVLTVSRGAVYFAPFAVLAMFALVPGRVRHLFALLPVAAAVGACTPRLLDVGDALARYENPGEALDRAFALAAVTGLCVAVLVAGVALAAARRPPSVDAARRLRLGGRIAAACIVVAVMAGGVVVAGDPVDRVDSAWASFKGGYADNATDKNRLVSGLGSSRYDVYRVALRVAREHPVAGIGADNFYQQYLREGDSDETPRYPHSVELRTLVQTGGVGVLLLLAFLIAAVSAAMRGMRAGGSVGVAAGGAATLAFVYWGLHGSIDWFWEWAGLGIPAFALLGLACAMAPRRPVLPAAGGAGRRPLVGGALAVLGGLVIAAPIGVLWLADAEQREAASVFATRPLASYAHLKRAASINPFASAPRTLEGTIALRFGDLRRADAAFGQALDRVPDDLYATLERGAVASALGDRPRALRLLRRAVVLSPSDALAREARAIVEAGGAVDVAELNRRILESTRLLAG